MFSKTSLIALGLLQVSHAQSTVTVKINTGECPATYSGTATSAPFPGVTGLARGPCPASYGSDYITADGVDYQIFCNTNFVGDDLSTVQATSLADCLAQCDDYVPNSVFGGSPCVAVSYIAAVVGSGNCELKYDITDVVFGTTFANKKRDLLFNTSPVDSAKRADFQVSPAISDLLRSGPPTSTGSSSGSVSATSTGSSSSASIVSSSSSVSDSAVSATSTSSSSGSISATSTSSSSGSISATISSSSSASIVSSSSSVSNPTVSPTGTPVTTDGVCGCPSSNNTLVYDSLGFDWLVSCNTTLQNPSDAGAILATSLDDCQLQCDNYDDGTSGCVEASYQPDVLVDGFNCFLSTDSAAVTVSAPDTCLFVIPAGEKKRLAH